jgi:hypothetical protein
LKRQVYLHVKKLLVAEMENTSDFAVSEQEIRDFLNNCELGQYADVLIAEGFDQLNSVSNKSPK